MWTTRTESSTALQTGRPGHPLTRWTSLWRQQEKTWGRTFFLTEYETYGIIYQHTWKCKHCDPMQNKTRQAFKANAAIILIATSQEPKWTRTKKQYAEQSLTTPAIQQQLFYRVYPKVYWDLGVNQLMNKFAKRRTFLLNRVGGLQTDGQIDRKESW